MSSVARKVLGLTAAEVVNLARAQVALLRAQLSLWTNPKGSLLMPAKVGTGPELSPVQMRRAAAFGWAITRASRYGVFRPQCLARSVALQRLLSGAGIPGSRLHLGVRPEAGALLAHAWVTLEGQVLGDDPAFVAGFRELPGTAVIDLL